MHDPKTVTIRGVTYPSMTDAARALMVSKAAISYAAKQGRLETVGISPVFVVRGVTYTCIGDIAKKFGLRYDSVRVMIARGRADKIGVGRGGRRDSNGRAVKFTFCGVEYRSLKHASDALGIPYNRMRELNKKARDASRKGAQSV